MGILKNIFKKEDGKEKKAKPSVKKGPLLKPIEKKETKKEVSKETKKTPKIPVIKKGQLTEHDYEVLHSPHVTEKATKLSEENKYVFKVSKQTNKNQIKQSVENTYGVDVEEIRVINIPKKKRRIGRHTGWRKGYKKAIVRVKKGQKIEILPR